MDKLLNIGQVAETLNVSQETLRIWDREGKLPSVRSDGGHRRWRESDILAYMGTEPQEEEKPSKMVCIYGRVSSHDQKQHGDLDRQLQRLSEHCAKKKYHVDSILKDVGSGLSDSRKGLLKLLNLVVEKKISKVVIEHKDRLTRFQYGLFEFFFKSYGVEIEVIEAKGDIRQEEELVEDMLSLIASFSGRLYGARSAKRRKDKKELVNAEVRE